MGLFKAFCKHLCPSETCPYKKELLAKEIALPKPKEKEEATLPLPAPNKGVNESHDKVELGWSFDDVVKRAFLMLEKRYENMLTENHQSIQVRLEYNLNRTGKEERSWDSRKELYIFRYYDSGMSASEIFKSGDDEETMKEKWKELIHRIDYFDKDFREEY